MIGVGAARPPAARSDVKHRRIVAECMLVEFAIGQGLVLVCKSWIADWSASGISAVIQKSRKRVMGSAPFYVREVGASALAIIFEAAITSQIDDALHLEHRCCSRHQRLRSCQ